MNSGNREITYAQAIAEALAEEMRRDENVIIMGEDVGPGGIFTATKGLREEFGEERVRDTPISEAAIAGAALGASLMGMRPVAEIMYEDFMTIASDQIVNHVAKTRYLFGDMMKCSLVIRTQGGSGRGNGAQHSQSLEVWFAHIPGLVVVMPSSPYEVKGLLKSAIRDDNPVIFIEHKILYFTSGIVPEEEYLLPLYEAEVKRKGDDVTVIATSLMVSRVMEAAKELNKDGIELEVIDARVLNPLDRMTIVKSVKKTGKAVVVHEACKNYGVGAEIAAVIMEEAFDYLDAPVVRLGGLNIPIPYEKSLEKASIPSLEQIIQSIKKMT